MYGSQPSLFKNKKAAELACQAFCQETKEHWLVVEKNIANNVPAKPNDIKTTTYYKIIRRTDLADAQADGFWPEMD